MKTSKQLVAIIGLPILCFVIGFFGVKWYLTSQDAIIDEPEQPALTGKMPSPVQKSEDDPGEQMPVVEVEEEVESPNGEPEVEASVETEIVSMEPLTLYAVQVASFTTAQSAAEAVAELVASGQPATVIEDEYYKVIVACSGQKETISQILPTVRETYEGAFTLEIPLSERRVEVVAKNADDFRRKDEMIKAALVEVGQQFTWPIGIEGSVTIAPAETIDTLEGEAARIDKSLTEVANQLDRMRSGSSEAAWQLYLDSVSSISALQ